MGFLSKVTGQRKTDSQVVVQQEQKVKPASQDRPRQIQQPPRYGKTCARCGTYFVAEKMSETMCHWCGRNWSPSLEALSE